MYESEWQTTCPDCGVTHSKADPCPYCYEVVDRYTVKLGNTVLYRGYDEDKMYAAYETPRAKLRTEKGVVINRRADHPYED